MKYCYILLISCLMLCSCTTELDYKGKVQPPRLVVNALLNADSIRNFIYVHRVEGTKAQAIMDAEVNLYVNDQFKEKGVLVYETNTDYEENSYEHSHRYRITTPFASGDKVEITVTTPDGEFKAWSEVIVPQPSRLAGVDTVRVFRTGDSYYYDYYLKLNVTVEDIPRQHDYYRLVVKREGSLFIEEEDSSDLIVLKNSTYRFDHREDLILNDGKPYNEDTQLFEEIFNQYAVFDDGHFKDSRCTIGIYVPLSNDFIYYWGSGEAKKMEQECTVRLLSINREDYYYYKALNIYDSDAYEPMLQEPLRFPSNVQGGLGFVGVSKESSFTFKMPDVVF